MVSACKQAYSPNIVQAATLTNCKSHQSGWLGNAFVWKMTKRRCQKWRVHAKSRHCFDLWIIFDIAIAQIPIESNCMTTPWIETWKNWAWNLLKPTWNKLYKLATFVSLTLHASRRGIKVKVHYSSLPAWAKYSKIFCIWLETYHLNLASSWENFQAHFDELCFLDVKYTEDNTVLDKKFVWRVCLLNNTTSVRCNDTVFFNLYELLVAMATRNASVAYYCNRRQVKCWHSISTMQIVLHWPQRKLLRYNAEESLLMRTAKCIYSAQNKKLGQ